MNVRAGDLAIVVGTFPLGKFLLGRIVKVLRQYDETVVDEPTWVVEFPHEITHPVTGQRSREVCAFARNLKPIRDPGEDAVEETLRRVEEPA